MSDTSFLPVEWSHIELTAGTVTTCSHNGKTNLDDVGAFKFFIDAVDLEGGRATFHVCADYEDAIRLGEETRNALEIDFPVRDNVVGSH